MTHLGPEYTSFARTIRNMLVREMPASVRSSGVAEAAGRNRAWFTDRNRPGGGSEAMEVRGQHLTTRIQGGRNYRNDQQSGMAAKGT